MTSFRSASRFQLNASQVDSTRLLLDVPGSFGNFSATWKPGGVAVCTQVEPRPVEGYDLLLRVISLNLKRLQRS
jgi:hypothetical protein